MGEGFGLREVECFALPSGLFISYRGEDGNPCHRRQAGPPPLPEPDPGG